MFFNEFDLKVAYEMKKEELDKEILAREYTRDRKKTKFIRYFVNKFTKNKVRENTELKPKCSEIEIQQECCTFNCC